VCKPDFDPHQTLEHFLEIAKEEYELRKYSTIDTFEKLQLIQKAALINWKMKNWGRR
jgi:hypothetical protein